MDLKDKGLHLNEKKTRYIYYIAYYMLRMDGEIHTVPTKILKSITIILSSFCFWTPNARSCWRYLKYLLKEL